LRRSRQCAREWRAPDYDLLKAVVHNAATRGPQDLDRARLLGRIAWVAVNRHRGARLRERFALIDWAA
jgi:hypothetical protein